jgi:hypothetical protein
LRELLNGWMWNELMWLRIWTDGRLLWTRQWIFRSHKRRVISWMTISFPRRPLLHIVGDLLHRWENRYLINLVRNCGPNRPAACTESGLRNLATNLRIQ